MSQRGSQAAVDREEASNELVPQKIDTNLQSTCDDLKSKGTRHSQDAGTIASKGTRVSQQDTGELGGIYNEYSIEHNSQTQAQS